MTNDATDAEVTLGDKVLAWHQAHPLAEVVVFAEAEEWYDREYGKDAVDLVLEEFGFMPRDKVKHTSVGVVGLAEEVVRLRNRPTPDVEAMAGRIADVRHEFERTSWSEAKGIALRCLGASDE